MPEQTHVASPLDLVAFAERHRTDSACIITDSPETIRELLPVAPRPTLVATWNEEALDAVGKVPEGVEVQRLAYEVHPGINALTQVREILLTAYYEGFYASTARVLTVVRLQDALEMMLFFDMSKDVSITRLKKELEFRAEPAVMERILQLAVEIAREGRERGHVGALFVVGDTKRVLNMSRQIVINPFFGHTEDDRNLLTGDTWETAKEFSQIDGAFIINRVGIIQASGRYIEVKDPVLLPSGFGGRHLAAAHVTKETKAVAVTVSETGIVRVFKDGEILMRIGVT